MDQLLSNATRYLDYFQALTEVAKALTGSLERDKVLGEMMRSLSALLRPRNWSLLLVDREKNELYFEVCVGPAAESIRNMRLPMGEGIAGWVVENKRPVVVARVADDPRFSGRLDAASSFRTASVACVPLFCRGEVLGVIELVREANEPPYNDEDLQILVPFADFAAIAIDNARNFAHVQELTIRDEWTGLFNARFLERCLEDECARAHRHGRPLSLVFFDLDHFKSINDNHGHRTGSATLRAVGALLGSFTRKTDRAIRYGGDEFVLVLIETDKAGAMRFAERLRLQLQADGIEGVLSDPIPVTASFGVASFGDDGNTPHQLLEAADRAMYEAKERGRNTVVDATDC